MTEDDKGAPWAENMRAWAEILRDLEPLNADPRDDAQAARWHAFLGLVEGEIKRRRKALRERAEAWVRTEGVAPKGNANKLVAKQGGSRYTISRRVDPVPPYQAFAEVLTRKGLDPRDHYTRVVSYEFSPDAVQALIEEGHITAEDLEALCGTRESMRATINKQDRADWTAAMRNDEDPDAFP